MKCGRTCTVNAVVTVAQERVGVVGVVVPVAVIHVTVVVVIDAVVAYFARVEPAVHLIRGSEQRESVGKGAGKGKSNGEDEDDAKGGRGQNKMTSGSRIASRGTSDLVVLVVLVHTGVNHLDDDARVPWEAADKSLECRAKIANAGPNVTESNVPAVVCQALWMPTLS